MIIGILSMQKIHNYGSFLQALSLKTILEDMGNEVYFIDIKRGTIYEKHVSFSGSLLSRVDKHFLKRVHNYFFTRAMDRIHIHDYETYLDTKKVTDEYDLAIIGSDEVFNATIPSSWGFTTQLFGDIPEAKHVITYAASCGSTTFEKVAQLKLTNKIRSALACVEMLSVRDENTKEFVKKITERECQINVDPVFLCNYDKWIPSIKIKKEFILVYAYENRINDPKEIRAIQEFATKKKLQIVCVGMQQRWCKNNIKANAFELLGYVKAASYVITDTFHGSVFSIKYNKRFGVIIRESNSNKLTYLLKQFGLETQCIRDCNEIEKVMDGIVDYKQVNNIIALEQRKSYEYLKNVLVGIEEERI